MQRRPKQTLTAEDSLHTTFKVYEGHPPRLNKRVEVQTKTGAFTVALAKSALVLYLAVKFLQWRRYDSLYFGWFDATLGVLG